MEITLQCFGAFRPFGEQLTLSLAKGALVSDIREALVSKLKELDSNFNKKALIDSSRFATETELLFETEPLKEDAIIAIIPPVSGG